MSMRELLAIDGYRAVTVAFGSASDPLDAGTYAVWSASDCFIRVSATGNADEVTDADGYPVFAGDAPILLRINSGARIGVAGDTGALSYHRVG